jgi:SRSO17 transposase
MLPESRCNGYQYSVPEFNLEVDDVKDFMEELRGFHEQFADCFARSESRSHFLNYMIGQFSTVPRKSIEPIAYAVEGSNVRPLQRFISDAKWNDQQILKKYHNLVADDLSKPDAAITFDESGFVKKGQDSIGVSRQYCGSVGKVENSQVGVFAGYVSDQGYALIDKRLFIPEKWFEEAFEDRRDKCNLPSDIEFKTKPQLAAEMLLEINSAGILPFKYVLADSIYGSSPTFIEAVESIPTVRYCVTVPYNTKCWPKRPTVITKKYKRKGKELTKNVLADTDNKPISLKELAKNTNKYFWYRRKVSEGTKGPIEYEFARHRIVLSDDNLPKKTVWLLVRRSLEDSDKYDFFISNISRSGRLNELIWLSGLRWSIEQSFRETKTELGMDHYEVRKFMGWHHHMLTCILAHFFLWHLKLRLGKKSTTYYYLAS